MPGKVHINANTVTPAALFAGPHCYTTPDFQRPYVWTAGKVAALWNDIVALAEGEDDRHFTGVILLQESDKIGDIECHKVIDGQQRLTTLQLLLAALRTVYQERNDPAAARNIYNLYLWNHDGVPPDQENLQYLQYKIHHSYQRDGAAFREYVRSEGVVPVRAKDDDREPYLLPVAGTPAHESPAFTAAYNLLYLKITDYGKNRRSLDNLKQAILNGVTLGVISANADEPTVYAMFSRLNSAGTPLEPPDLIKAETFRQITQLCDCKSARARKLWDDNYSDAYWQERYGSGATDRSNLGHLFHHWLCAQTGDFVTNEDTNDPIMEAYADTTRELGTIRSLEVLERYAASYRAIQTQNLPEHQRFIRDFHIAGYNAAYPLALYCLSELPLEAQSQALAYVGNYLMRLALKGANTSALNKTAASMAHRAADAIRKIASEIPPEHQAESIAAEILGITGTVRCPDDIEIINHLALEPIGITRHRAITQAIVEHMEGANVADPTLEHIMPQQWQQHWPLPDPDDAPAETLRNISIEMLGNLTIIPSHENTLASNSKWDDKRQIFARSELTINRQLAAWDTWDESAIMERSKELAKIACQIWPKPQPQHDMFTKPAPRRRAANRRKNAEPDKS